MYLAGRLFQDENDRWIYESYNSAFTTEKYPDLVATLSELNKKAQEEYTFYTDAIKKADDAVKANEEERKAAAKAAASKKKKGKKDAKDADDDDKKEEVKSEVKKEIDLNLPADFT